MPSSLEPDGGVGTNGVRDIASGVHFVHSTIDNHQSQMARVVLTR
ncbi:MAG: hypothetical protein NTX53_03815 [candidate division WOR-3 bacterium]|nr:hypothetical protein [candidate division WOR-3 bacterium]